ncbi:hypothetical protein JTE90_024276 [Oedothorax gibbosus]|uniref:Protein max n=1 Tax=Oedothorax gibbosus TaxID=931172 RepID=A0AAV6VNQ1_9ARAC|nr:hypothetical protein JTE90_024276 [Oedothorax gibbosus]
MSDDERFLDNESDADKRAYHNLLERKRRDHIKDSFSSLRDALPAFKGDKASRAQILKKAADYIQITRRKNASHLADIDDLKRQNRILEEEIRTLQKARATGNYEAAAPILSALHSLSTHHGIKPSTLATYEQTDSDSEDSSEEESSNQRKKSKMNSNDL